MSQGRVTYMFMEIEHLSLGDGGDQGDRNHPATRRGSGDDAVERISAALAELRRARIRPMSRDEANRVTGMLGEMQSMVTYLLCDVARQVAEAWLRARPRRSAQTGCPPTGARVKEDGQDRQAALRHAKVKERSPTAASRRVMSALSPTRLRRSAPRP